MKEKYLANNKREIITQIIGKNELQWQCLIYQVKANLLQIRQNQQMQAEDNKNHISRIKLRNIAHPNYFKPVTQRNNIFCKVKRNSAILSRAQNVQDKFHHYLQTSQISNRESITELMSKKRSVHEVRHSSRYSSAENSAGSASSLGKRNLNLHLPQIRLSKQLSLSSSPSNKAFDDSQNSSKNQIQGTPIGVLSTKQIIKKYEIKKLNEQINKKKFLDHYIQNLKNDSFQIEEEGQDLVGKHFTESKQFFVPNQSTNLSSSQSIKEKDKNLNKSQEKLVHLLQNRLTDRDFIDFNVKLFEKRDINKKKFFQRYHNILKQQRNQIIKK